MASLGGESFKSVRVGVTLRSRKKPMAGSVDIQDHSAVVLSSSHDASTSPYELRGAEEMAALPVLDLPDEPRVRDVMRELEHEHPPLKYKIVCHNDGLYTTAVMGFLRDIARDDDYEIYAVNNWCHR